MWTVKHTCDQNIFTGSEPAEISSRAVVRERIPVTSRRPSLPWHRNSGTVSDTCTRFSVTCWRLCSLNISQVRLNINVLLCLFLERFLLTLARTQTELFYMYLSSCILSWSTFCLCDFWQLFLARLFFLIIIIIIVQKSTTFVQTYTTHNNAKIIIIKNKINNYIKM